MSMGWEDVSKLWPVTGLLFTPQVICEHGEPRWNYTEREKPNNSEKTFASTIFSTTNLTWTDLGANPALRGKRPAITEVWLGEER
jgi:hypothetical protein